MTKRQVSSDVLLFSILCRQEDCLDSRSEGPNKLLLDTADGSNTAAEGNFALVFVSFTCSKMEGDQEGENYSHGHRGRYSLAREEGN